MNSQLDKIMEKHKDLLFYLIRNLIRKKTFMNMTMYTEKILNKFKWIEYIIENSKVFNGFIFKIQFQSNCIYILLGNQNKWPSYWHMRSPFCIVTFQINICYALEKKKILPSWNLFIYDFNMWCLCHKVFSLFCLDLNSREVL